jgi:RHS repeat-associated protein
MAARQMEVASLNVSVQAGTPTTVPVSGTARYVKVQLTGTDYLSPAEVKVWGTAAANLALNKPATQSSDLGGGVASRAVDGNTNGNWYNNSVTHTNSEAGAWWQVDLGGMQPVQSVEVWNRTDCCSERLTYFKVWLLDSNQMEVTSINVSVQAGTPTTLPVSGTARYVKVQLLGTDYLSLAEVKVWGTASGPAGPYGALQRLDVSAAGRLLAVDEVQTDGSKVTSYLMADRQGSTRVFMNAAGAVTSRHDYLPFGEELGAGTGAPGSPTGMRTAAQGYNVADNVRQRYADPRLDDATGLDHTLWRKLETRSGRWTTPDPYGKSLRVGNPQSFNRYAYVFSDPVNFVDRNGLDPGDVVNGPCPNVGSCNVNVLITFQGAIGSGGGSGLGDGFEIVKPVPDEPTGGGPVDPQDPVIAKEYNLSHTAVSDLVRDNNKSKASNGVILCQAYKESRAQGYSQNGHWYSPPVGTFYNASQGSVSHRGLMQVGPVAAGLGGLGNGQGEGLTDAQLQAVNPDYINNIWDPAANIRAGTGYMQYLMDHYHTDVEGALERFRGSPGSATAKAYASNILDCAAKVDAGDALGGLGIIR